MRSIFGIFQLNGRSADPEHLIRMGAACASDRPVGYGNTIAKSSGVLGLGYTISAGSGGNDNSPEQFCRGVIEAADGNLFVASARLDNREELRHQLVSGHTSVTDEEIIRSVLRQRGERCVNGLYGDWCFAAGDPFSRTLLIARDHFGHQGLYYYRDSERFVFASSINAVLAAPGVPHELDLQGLASFVRGVQRDSATTYQGIHRLPLARVLKINESGMSVRQYWDPHDCPEVRLASDGDYTQAFTELYEEAVRCRLSSGESTALTLSGGLDSGSTAALAAAEFGSRGERVRAYTSVPAFADAARVHDTAYFGDERPLVETLCQQYANLDTQFVPARSQSPIAAIRQALRHVGHPFLAASNLYWLQRIMQLAAHDGVTTLLTGHGGNYTISWAGDRDYFLRSLLRQGKIRSYLTEIRAWRSGQGEQNLRTLLSQFGRSVIPRSWFRRRDRRRVIRDTPLFRAEFIKQIRQARPRVAAKSTLKVSAARRKCAAMMRTDGNSAWQELARPYGIQVATPALDVRLVEFCLGIPEEQYTNNGQKKLLIRRAMKGRMPDQFLWNNKRGKQSSDIVQRVREHRDEFESVLSALQQSSLSDTVLNLQLMQKIFNQSMKENTPELGRQMATILMAGVMTGLYLQRFENRSSFGDCRAA